MTTKPTMTHRTSAQTEDAAIQLEHDFVEIIRQRIGLNETLATIHAQEIVRGLRERHGGRELWIPASDKSERNAAILRDFHGSNIEEVVKRYGIKRAQIYRIVGGARPRGKGDKPGAPSIGVSSPAAPVRGGQGGATAPLK